MIPPVQPIWQDAYWQAGRAEIDGFTVMVASRSDLPATDLGAFFASTENLQARLSMVHRSRAALLVDFRKLKVGRSDPEYDRRAAPYVAEMFRDWLAVISVVKTISGRMQVNRQGQQFGEPEKHRTFANELEAWAYLVHLSLERRSA